MVVVWQSHRVGLHKLVGGSKPAGYGRAIAASHQVAIDTPTGHGTPGGKVDGDGSLVEERIERHWEAGHGQAPQRVQQVVQAGLARHVAVDRLVGAVTQGQTNEPAEHPAWPGLDEHPGSGRVHGLDLIGEAHRLGHLSGQQTGHVVGVAIGAGRDVGVHVEERFGQVDLVEACAERRGRSGHHRAVKGTGHVQQCGPFAQPSGLVDHRPNCGCGPGDHRLVGCVAVGHHHAGIAHGSA